MCRCVRSLSTSFWTALGVTTSSASPWMMMPDEGQGARKLKSYMFAGGAIEMKPRISGRRISSCMPIQAPKLTPANPGRLGFRMDLLHPVERRRRIRQLADAVVERPWLLPTPRKVEAQGREAALHERLIEQLDDLVVHRPAGLRVRVQDQRDRRARARPRGETAFQTALGAGKITSGMGAGLVANRQ